MVRQLTRGLSAKELEASGFAPYYIDHTAGVWPQAAGGVPFSATEFQSSGDAIADLVEDMAAEQKARKTYDNILRLAKDQEVADPIRFLREREIVHFQRFGEALRLLQEELDSKNYYAFNPNFDCMQNTTRIRQEIAAPFTLGGYLKRKRNKSLLFLLKYRIHRFNLADDLLQLISIVSELAHIFESLTLHLMDTSHTVLHTCPQFLPPCQ